MPLYKCSEMLASSCKPLDTQGVTDSKRLTLSTGLQTWLFPERIILICKKDALLGLYSVVCHKAGRHRGKKKKKLKILGLYCCK